MWSDRSPWPKVSPLHSAFNQACSVCGTPNSIVTKRSRLCSCKLQVLKMISLDSHTLTLELNGQPEKTLQKGYQVGTPLQQCFAKLAHIEVT